MHRAFDARIVLEHFPLNIECIAANDGNLVVGTKQGHLFMYSIASDSLMRPKISLLRSNKCFSHKPITQLAVVPEHQILISLSDQLVSIYDLTIFNFPLLGVLTKTKGASCFDVDIKHHTSLTGERYVTVLLVVAVRKKLKFFYWKSRQFQDLTNDISLADNAKCLSWCGEGVIVALKNDYYYVKLTDQQIELNVGRNDRPLIASLPDGGRGLVMDGKVIEVDRNGDRTSERETNWSETPTSLIFSDPFWLAVVSKGVQVASLDPYLDVQLIPLENPHLMMSSYSGSKNQHQIFVASSSNIWILCAMPICSQIPELLKDKQYEFASKLSDLWNETKSNKEAMKQQIKKLQAVHLFCEGNFSDAMKLFFNLNSDLLYVIGLFPALVPEEYRARLQYPQPIPSFEGKQLDEAFRELIHFLLQMRHSLKSLEKSNDSPTTSSNLKVNDQKLQIIDTTLLKCYLKTNDALIVNLLRMPDSRVSLEEGERILRQAHKYSELVLLLRNRREHSKALDLLSRHSKRSDSPLYGHTHTVNYLQTLGPEYLDLTFQYSSWVLRMHPEDGLSIFLEGGDLGEAESLPRPKVLNFIKKTNQDLTVPYLEHLVFECKDTNPVIHNELIYQYKEIVCKSSYSEEDEKEKVVYQNSVRCKLIDFLRTSKSYTAATLLVHFPQDGLFEERAILFGRLGQHKQALQIFLDVIQDVDKAFEYCHAHSSQLKNQVYLTFLKLLLSRSSLGSIGNTKKPSPPPINSSGDVTLPYDDVIGNILRNYSHCLDVTEVLRIFPVNCKAQMLREFVLRSMVRLSRLKKNHQVLRGLTQAVLHEVESYSKSSENQKIFLSENTMCSICRKRFTNSSAFAWHSSGEILHFMCNEQRNLKR